MEEGGSGEVRGDPRAAGSRIRESRVLGGEESHLVRKSGGENGARGRPRGSGAHGVGRAGRLGFGGGAGTGEGWRRRAAGRRSDEWMGGWIGGAAARCPACCCWVAALRWWVGKRQREMVVWLSGGGLRCVRGKGGRKEKETAAAALPLKVCLILSSSVNSNVTPRHAALTVDSSPVPFAAVSDRHHPATLRTAAGLEFLGVGMRVTGTNTTRYPVLGIFSTNLLSAYNSKRKMRLVVRYGQLVSCARCCY